MGGQQGQVPTHPKDDACSWVDGQVLAPDAHAWKMAEGAMLYKKMSLAAGFGSQRVPIITWATTIVDRLNMSKLDFPTMVVYRRHLQRSVLAILP